MLNKIDIRRLVDERLVHAYSKHGTEQWGRHEFKAIFEEEYDEMWDAVKQDMAQTKVEDEVIDMIAVCFRYLETGDRYRESVNAR